MSDIRHNAIQDNRSAAQLERARRGARRTALLLGGIALAVYVGFILMSALSK